MDVITATTPTQSVGSGGDDLTTPRPSVSGSDNVPTTSFRGGGSGDGGDDPATPRPSVSSVSDGQTTPLQSNSSVVDDAATPRPSISSSAVDPLTPLPSVNSDHFFIDVVQRQNSLLTRGEAQHAKFVKCFWKNNGNNGKDSKTDNGCDENDNEDDDVDDAVKFGEDASSIHSSLTPIGQLNDQSRQ